jgi:hypothetical protein
MAGTLKIEISGATKEELKRQLEEVIRELEKINFRPGNRITLGSPHAWKVAGAPQAWKIGTAAWKVAGAPQAWKIGTASQPFNLSNPQAWKVTYET